MKSNTKHFCLLIALCFYQCQLLAGDIFEIKSIDDTVIWNNKINKGEGIEFKVLDSLFIRPCNSFELTNRGVFNRVEHCIKNGEWFFIRNGIYKTGYFRNDTLIGSWNTWNLNPWYLKIREEYNDLGIIVERKEFVSFGGDSVLIDWQKRKQGRLIRVGGYDVIGRLLIRNVRIWFPIFIFSLLLRIALNLACLKSKGQWLFWKVAFSVFKLWWKKDEVKSLVLRRTVNLINVLTLLSFILLIIFLVR